MNIYYDSMNYSNVIKASYIVPIQNEELLKKAQNDFISEIENNELLPNGKLTYFFEQLNESVCRLSFLLPVDKIGNMKENKLQAYSYYSQEQVLCCMVPYKDLEKIEEITDKMKEKCKKDGCRMYGPLYFVLPKSSEDDYLYVKVGITDA